MKSLLQSIRLPRLLTKRGKLAALGVLLLLLIAFFSAGESSPGLNRFKALILGSLNGQAPHGDQAGDFGGKRSARYMPYKDSRLERLFYRRFRPEATVEDFRGFLEVTGESPAAIGLVAMATGDPDLLQKLESFAGSDPGACEVLFLKSGSPADRLHWADALIATDGDNSLGFMLRCSALLEMGQNEEALKACREALTLPYKEPLSEMITLTPEAAATIPDERALEIVYADSRGWAQGALEPGLGALAKSVKLLVDSGTLTQEDLQAIDRQFSQLKESMDPRLSTTANRIVEGEKISILKKLEGSDFQKDAISLWGDLPTLKAEDFSRIVESHEKSQEKLRGMSKEQVNSEVADWFAAGN